MNSDLRLEIGSMQRCAGAFASLIIALLAAPASQAALEFQELSATHIQAAEVQSSNDDYAGAIGNYSRAVVLIEQGAGIVSLDLVQPLTGLATAQRATQQERLAAQTLRRAVGVLRRGAGLYDRRQYPLLIQLVDLDSQAGELDSAADTLQYLQRLSTNAGADSPVGQAGALSEIADWRCRIGRFEEGRQLHRKAIDALALHAARFRPRILNGRAVDTRGVRYRQEFREAK